MVGKENHPSLDREQHVYIYLPLTFNLIYAIVVFNVFSVVNLSGG